ncbi:MAG: hypothetical protein HY901_11355 [Deltaproteobacteria bacterium]|nr:hypothetical protein [Deltaproteobacteria bacterium]
MKSLARACLRLAMLAVPVVIAACYGPIARYSRSGKVIDKDTHANLSDIEVSCVSKDGIEAESARSYQGDFTLYYDVPCDHFEASDTVSPARYQKQTVAFSEESAGTLTISMEKVQ